MFPKIAKKAFLAPMARITDPAFRSLCKKYGAGMTVTELMNAKGLLQNPEKIKDICKRADNEDRFAVQLFGSDPKELSQAAKLLEPYCDFIDLNLGCPAYKICRVGAGSELLKNPETVGKIVSSMVNAVNIPITVKTRLGINDNHTSVFDILKIVQDNGASLLTVHGRTRDQAYSGVANWETIKQVKEQAEIPIVGNGDINSPELFKERLSYSSVDYITIGRAASGNPLLFKQINDFLDSGFYKKYSVNERLKVFQEYVELSKEFNTKILLQKLQAQHFTKGLKGAGKVREQISKSKTSEELQNALTSFLNKA